MAGQGRLLFVVGEPGIGKTALLSEFLRRARERPDRPFTLCRGRCAEQYGAGEAYLPFLDAIGSLLMGRAAERTREMVRTYAPTWSLQLPSLFSGDAEALQRQTVGASRDRMLREMGDAVRGDGPGVPGGACWARTSTGPIPPAWTSCAIWPGASPTGASSSWSPCATPISRPRTPPCTAASSTFGPTARRSAWAACSASDIGAWLDATFAPHRFPAGLRASCSSAGPKGHPLFLGSLAQFLRDRGDIVWDGQAFALARPLYRGRRARPRERARHDPPQPRCPGRGRPHRPAARERSRPRLPLRGPRRPPRARRDPAAGARGPRDRPR